MREHGVASSRSDATDPAARFVGRVPTLDGLRALSLSLVFLAHQFVFVDEMFAVGQLGVRVFFVISGYIITLLLVREREKTGEISLRGFYWRRTWRIFPPCSAYVAALFLLSRAGLVSPIPSRDFFFALTYTSNYVDGMNPKLLHLWSLSVEEQFYLLWPVVFKWSGLTRARHLVLGVLIVVPMLRLATLAGYLPAHHLGWTFHTCADALATGCLIPLLSADTRVADRLDRLPGLVASLSFLLGTGLAVAWEIAQPAFAPFLAPTLANLAIALFVSKETRPGSTSAAFRLLNQPWIVQLGLWSYSLYLWQQPFLLSSQTSRWFTSFPYNYAVVFGLALVSYYLIERPSLTLRKRLEQG